MISIIAAGRPYTDAWRKNTAYLTRGKDRA